MVSYGWQDYAGVGVVQTDSSFHYGNMELQEFALPGCAPKSKQVARPKTVGDLAALL